MKFSIITPTFNSEKTITRNIQSVIDQTYKNFEQIIVDNLSSDKTIELAKNLYRDASIINKLIIITEKDNGIADAFNKGIKAATGNIITILNSDDAYYDNEILSEVIEAFNNPQILIVHGDIHFIDSVYGTNIRHPLPTKIMKGVQYNHPTMFIKRDLYNKIGLYNTGFKVSMDYEFYCRIALNYDPDKISVYLKYKPLVKMYSGGMSWKNELKSIYEIKKALMLHDFWNTEGKKFYYTRLYRTKLKKILDKFKLQSFVKTWRKLKWGN